METNTTPGMKDIIIPVNLYFRVRDDVDTEDVRAIADAALEHGGISETMSDALYHASWSNFDWDYDPDGKCDSYDGFGIESARAEAEFIDRVAGMPVEMGDPALTALVRRARELRPSVTD